MYVSAVVEKSCIRAADLKCELWLRTVCWGNLKYIYRCFSQNILLWSATTALISDMLSYLQLEKWILLGIICLLHELICFLCTFMSLKLFTHSVHVTNALTYFHWVGCGLFKGIILLLLMFLSGDLCLIFFVNPIL